MVDAVIVGAGAAGLAAARELSHAGLSAVVVEARPRIGGRIYTIHDRNSPLPIELGAEFIHGNAPETFAVIRAAGLLVDELPNRHLWSRDGTFSTIPDFWEKVEEVRRDIARKLRKQGGDLSFLDYLQRTQLPSDLRQMLMNFVEGYHAAHVEKVSARWLAAGAEETEEDAGGNKQFRIVSGSDALVWWLRGGLDPDRCQVRLSTIASEMKWKRGAVTLLCRSASGALLQPIHARAAVIALPLGVLKGGPDTPGALRFIPELDQKKDALDKLEFGHVFKMVLRFRESFWAGEDFINDRLEESRSEPGELNFVHARDAEIPTWWTAVPSNAPLITAWAGGPRAEALLSESEPVRLERTLAGLAKTLDVERGTIDELLESWSIHDWRNDPFSRGAYTYVGVGGVAAQKALAKPLDGTLFFAGEATDLEQTATVAGAIASGRRAGREVIRSLRD